METQGIIIFMIIIQIALEIWRRRRHDGTLYVFESEDDGVEFLNFKLDLDLDAETLGGKSRVVFQVKKKPFQNPQG